MGVWEFADRDGAADAAIFIAPHYEFPLRVITVIA
jgi:hypothetical protein